MGAPTGAPTTAPAGASPVAPLVLITGAGGNIGRSLAAALAPAYRVVGLDRQVGGTDFPTLQADFASADSIALALHRLRAEHGAQIASVIHLAAYFDFDDTDHPLYQAVNVEGTRLLLRGLQDFEVEQFVYASTMLVHQACRPGERIDEQQPLAPRWAYPRSKAEAEAVITQEHGAVPVVLLRLAGMYDDAGVVPSLAHQIARIHQRDVQSYLYAGSTLVGQSMVHRDDVLQAFKLTIDARHRLPAETRLLIGEADAMGYDALQDEVGYLLHGSQDWPTLRVPKVLAAAGTWAQAALEPLIPDALDQGQKPFIRPFMVALADDHYALDIRQAQHLIGWVPRHRLKDTLPRIVAALKADPARWYARHGITPPAWLAQPAEGNLNAEALRSAHETLRRSQHGENRWAHFANIGLGSWLVTQPLLVNVQEPALRSAEIGLGLLLMAFAALALSWRATWARWACAVIGTVVMAAPFVFWTGNAAAYLSDTLVGALIFGFAVCMKPEPGTSAVAALTGPSIPLGWTYNPSSWSQRVPIIMMALLGLYVSRYLAAYQLGHIPSVWDPYFAGSASDPRNGTEEIITSWVSEAWPFPDAAIGGYTYLMEILTGIVGTARRWRTMPWLVIAFGLMIAPLGITSIVFIIIQPVVLGTWSIVALLGAAAILVQIPYSLDELIATLQFLRRRAQAGQNWLRVLFVGDTDTRSAQDQAAPADEFDRAPGAVLKDMLSGGVNLPWNLALAGVIGLSLLFSRLTVGAEGAMADAHHGVGALVLTVVSVAAAEVARAARFVNLALGLALMAMPWMVASTPLITGVTLVCGLLIAALSVRRGRITASYGGWNRFIV